MSAWVTPGRRTVRSSSEKRAVMLSGRQRAGSYSINISSDRLTAV